jgi:hypothetical protein
MRIMDGQLTVITLTNCDCTRGLRGIAEQIASFYDPPQYTNRRPSRRSGLTSRRSMQVDAEAKPLFLQYVPSPTIPA